MNLCPPFIISARLAPGLKVGDVTISMLGLAMQVQDRDKPCNVRFAFDFPDRSEAYVAMHMPRFRAVEAFELLLARLACREVDGFHPALTAWASTNFHAIEAAQADLMDEDGNVNHNLIT